ncbi:MAG: hypothetical protein ACT4PU_06600 [Planctomycetota bacterium]
MIIRAMLCRALLIWACASGPALDELVSGRFDLLGWQRLGVARFAAPVPDAAATVALLDDDPDTAVSVLANAARTLTLDFDPPQEVERVELALSGPGACRVRLTVVQPDDQRFQAGESEVSGGQTALFRLTNAKVRSLSFEIETLEEDGESALAGLAVFGRMRIVALSLDDPPSTLPVGGSFPCRVLGRDEHGGRPDLSERTQLVVQPARALAFLADRRAVTRVAGPLTIEPRLATLGGPVVSVLVTPVEPPPPAPQAVAGMQVVQLLLEGQPPFEIFRRHAGEKAERSLGRAERTRFYDDSVLPGTAYTYSARRVDRLDNPLTEASAGVRVRTLTRFPPGWSAPGRVPALLVLFVDSLLPEERAEILASLEAARLFVYRHSAGRIVLDPLLLELSGPTPPTVGPTLHGIEALLRRQGLREDRFGLVFAISNDLAGDYGGFSILGRGLGAMVRGRGLRVPTPAGALGPDPDLAFAFVHELQHALARLQDEQSAAGARSTGHFTEDFGAAGMLGAWRGQPFDAGESWDGHAQLLAATDGWELIGPPWRRPLEVLDTDGDGLVDDDARLPIDEQRLGTDPNLADTDGDGLSDLAELRAGLYRGSDPRQADTDGDGLPDGEDRWPLSSFRGSIPRGTTPQALADDEAVSLAAAWNDRELLFEITTAKPCDAFLEVDGSGALGRWETDVNTGTAAKPGSDVYAGPARFTLRAHTPPLGVFLGERRVPGARLTAEALADGRTRLLLSLPAALGPGAQDVYIPVRAEPTSGLRLRPGTTLGLALTVRPSRASDPAPLDPFADEAWRSLFETHRFLDARLVD